MGKAGHFRRHGIPIPKQIHHTDLSILHYLLREFLPERVILLGDLFHSTENLEWMDFVQFLKAYPGIEFVLIQGNHDILSHYPEELKVVLRLNEHPFSFTHIREDDQLYNISGHIHPGITVRGTARQGMTLPCFLFSQCYAVLPAFGQFTGIKKIKHIKNDRVYAIANDSVIQLR